MSTSGSVHRTQLQVVEECGCDDTTGDGVGDVRFFRVWAVDPTGVRPPALLGTYRGSFSTPYAPVSPVECA